MIQERLLQFIWQFSLFKPGRLVTSDGEQVVVILPGQLNRNAGPDFIGARIRIGSTILIGNVELHINATDWIKHRHEEDPAYRNIILHVVHHNDWPEVTHPFPTPILELAEHIPEEVIERYRHLQITPQQIPCAVELKRVNPLIKQSWLHRMLAERWEQKLAGWQNMLKEANGDWRNLLYWRIAANFGFKVNEMPFLMLAQSIPLNILTRCRNSLFQLEALLFGQAGLLQGNCKDEYQFALQTEYRYLRHKYRLEPISGHLWKFLRMRPANFPTVRIAQFAALVHQSVHLMAQIVENTAMDHLVNLLQVSAGKYWDNHFRFGEPHAGKRPKRLGTTTLRNLIINTIAPIQFLYATHHGLKDAQINALHLLETIDPEKNNIIDMWNYAGWSPENAAQSQAMIQLYNSYCNARRCLECGIGLKLLRSGGSI